MKYRLKYLKELPTIAQGQTDDLKIENKSPQGTTEKVWLSRLTEEDGEPYSNKVTVEQYVKRYEPVKRKDYRSSKRGKWEGRWETVEEYEAI